MLESMSPFLAIGLGLAVGLEHAFEPDHVAAVSTQVSKLKSKNKMKSSIHNAFRKSSVVGLLWGMGHTTTIVLVGLLVYVLAIQITDNVFSGFEFVVGAMLVFLGVATILNKRKGLFGTKHKHPHQHQDGKIHLDEHSHVDSNHRHGHISYVIGMVHGLAGSGALVVLVLASFQNTSAMITFTILFGVGSTVGMAILSGMIGLPIAISSHKTIAKKAFRYGAGGFSLILGFFTIYDIGVLNGLL